MTIVPPVLQLCRISYLRFVRSDNLDVSLFGREVGRSQINLETMTYIPFMTGRTVRIQGNVQ